MDTDKERQEAAGGLIHNWQRPRDPDLPFPYIDVNHFAGTVSKYVRGENRKWHIQTRSVDLQNHIDANKRAQNDNRNSFKVDGVTFHRVASVPMHMVSLWRKIYGVDALNPHHEKEVNRLLNDPDLRYFKTTSKTI